MKAHMPDHPLLSQYQFELDSWGRLLAFQKEELVYCKNRLAEVVNDSSDDEMLLVAEGFQEEFLAQERVIGYLSGELKRQVQLLEKETYLDGEIYTEVVKGQKTLRREIKKGEESFVLVKEDFGKFLNSRF